MESSDIVKLIWGAVSDVQSLLHQEQPRRLGIQVRSLVDVQLGFSTHDRRLGLARIPRENVHQSLLAGLPAKEVIDFNSPHSENRRALPIPLSETAAKYAMDDLHRLEAVLRSQCP